MKIKVILGSTRQGSFGDKPARWIFEELKKREDVEIELLDLRDFELPFFDSPTSPSSIKEPYQNEVVKRWTAKIAEADGFVIVTPEYNHGYPAVLKNAMDWVYKEWNKKAVGFVSYGSVMGARSIEQLRLVAVELQMAPIRAAVYIPGDIYKTARNNAEEGDSSNPFESLNERANVMIDQLIWWTKALKKARDEVVV
jgi:NAD(P)H-dependent FMN reductase